MNGVQRSGVGPTFPDVAFHVGLVVLNKDDLNRTRAPALSGQQERAGRLSAGKRLHPDVVWFVLVGKQRLGAVFYLS